MQRICFSLVGLLAITVSAQAYIEVPHSLGKCVNDSTNIVLMELTRVNTDKNLLIFKKLSDIKGKHPTDEIKHNIGKKGFHEREWKNIMAWAEVGKKAMFMYNGDASETCIGTYWYQCYREGEWWGMSHAEPFLLRTFYGEVDRLAEHCTKIHKGEEVIVTCLADGSKEQLHQRKGKLQRLKASLKKQDYNAKRDFVGWGGDGEDIQEFKTVELLPSSAKGWRFGPAKGVKEPVTQWAGTTFDDSKWAEGKAPIGYGEDELAKRQGTIIKQQGEDFLFRRHVEIPAELLSTKGIVFQLSIASDDNATVYLNGSLADQDPEADHEFAYFNRDVELPLKLLKPGNNILAVIVRNKPKSSDLYFDLELTAQIPLPRPAKKKDNTAVVVNPKNAPKVTPKTPTDEPRDPNALTIDKAKKTITINAEIALRKLPNLEQRYPIEVIGTYAAPRGQKAHETVLTMKGVRPSDVHAALETLGLKAGKPAYGEGTKASGPEVKVFIEFTHDSKVKRIPIEEALVHRATGKPMVALKWFFTGSVRKQPDPEKDETVYGADLTGTFLSLFPVTDCCVLQTQLTMKDEPNFKLETATTVLPREGTAVKLILVAE